MVKSTYDLVREKASLAHSAGRLLSLVDTKTKNQALLEMADALLRESDFILSENEKDMQRARANAMKDSMQDRLKLTLARIEAMAEGLRQVANLQDPVGDVLSERTLENGLYIQKVRVPLGVIGIIYEARPNVTADAIGLCIKSGNAVVLKGGSEALSSNAAIAKVLTQAAEASGIPQGAIQLIDITDRDAVNHLIRMNEFVDVVIPRGGAGLIKFVVQNATVPVIETGSGVCHTFVDASADIEKARQIAFNAKVQRPSVCNALETLLVHEAVAPTFLPLMLKDFFEAGVTVMGCEKVQAYDQRVLAATEEDWSTEYGDLRLSVKVVSSLTEAIEHISSFSTKHSECIVTEDQTNALTFQRAIDAAAVYVNASTRFTDGFEFGFGAEIGISTQKLHARGPMALPELTSYKYLITGEGQIRR